MRLVNPISAASLDNTGCSERTLEVESPDELWVRPLPERARSLPTDDPQEGQLLSGRYRVLHPVVGGWLAFDERLARPVFVATLLAEGCESPAQRIRREAARGAPLADGIVAGDAAFAVRALSYTA